MVNGFEKKTGLILLSFIFCVFYLNAQDYEDFLDQYDILITVAGKGDIDGGEINGWNIDYEGGSALEAELSRPHFVMCDSMGNMYIADKDAHAIRLVDTMGNIKTVAGTNAPGDNGDGPGTEHQLNAPNGLWVSPGGDVFILDLNNDKIRKLDSFGELTTIVHDTNGIDVGRGLWVNRPHDSVFYSCGTEIRLWTASSGIEIYKDGFVQLGNLVQDYSGNIVVTDRGAHQVYRINKNDTTADVIAGNGSITGGGDGMPALESALYGVRGIWFLEDGSYFLATHEGSKIWHVDTSGILHQFLDGMKGDQYHSGDGENFRTPGYKISEARSVNVDYKGNVLIVENDRGFVRTVLRKSDIVSNKRNIDQSYHNCLFPNPSSKGKNVFLKFYSGKSGNIDLFLFNQNGEVVKILQNVNSGKGLKSIEIEVSTFDAGIYFIQLRKQNSIYYFKLAITG